MTSVYYFCHSCALEKLHPSTKGLQEGLENGIRLMHLSCCKHHGPCIDRDANCARLLALGKGNGKMCQLLLNAGG